MSKHLALALQSSGAMTGVVAAWTVSATAGLAVLSVALIVFGVAVERQS